jgi:DNA-binding NarL/FixJ family response regulator
VEEVLPGIGRDLPEVVLVDLGLPGKSGIEGIRLLKQRARPSINTPCSWALLLAPVSQRPRSILMRFAATADAYDRFMGRYSSPLVRVAAVLYHLSVGAMMGTVARDEHAALLRQARPQQTETHIEAHGIARQARPAGEFRDQHRGC